MNVSKNSLGSRVKECICRSEGGRWKEMEGGMEGRMGEKEVRERICRCALVYSAGLADSNCATSQSRYRRECMRDERVVQI